MNNVNRLIASSSDRIHHPTTLQAMGRLLTLAQSIVNGVSVSCLHVNSFSRYPFIPETGVYRSVYVSGVCI